MKAFGILAALALMAAPLTLHAQSTTTEPEAGGVSQGGVLPVFAAGSIPAGAVVVGGVVILAGVVVGVVAASSDSTVATTGTN